MNHYVVRSPISMRDAKLHSIYCNSEREQHRMQRLEIEKQRMRRGRAVKASLVQGRVGNTTLSMYTVPETFPCSLVSVACVGTAQRNLRLSGNR
jgi:hypothetical protein